MKSSILLGVNGHQTPCLSRTQQATPPSAQTDAPTPLPADGLTTDPDLTSDADASSDEADPQLPELGVLALATTVGIFTGCTVVLFNNLVHAVQDDLVWTSAPRIAAFGNFGLQRDPTISSWQFLLLPPVAGGAAVSALRALVGGFDGDPRSVATPRVKQSRAAAPPSPAVATAAAAPDARTTPSDPQAGTSHTHDGAVPLGPQSTPCASAAGSAVGLPAASANMLGSVESPRVESGSTASTSSGYVDGSPPRGWGQGAGSSAAALADARPASCDAAAHSDAHGVSDSHASPAAASDAAAIEHGSMVGEQGIVGSRAGDAGGAGLAATAHAAGVVDGGLRQVQTPHGGRPAWLRRAAFRPYVKTVAAAFTLGSGASLGPEGPSVDLGKANAQLLTRLAHLQGRMPSTDMLAAGAAAGLAAGFGAPMSGVLFAVETVLLTASGSRSPPSGAPPETEETDDGGLLIATVLVASVFAAMVSQAGLGSEPAFHVPSYTAFSIFELPLWLAVGLLCGFAASGIGYLSRSSEQAFSRLRRAGLPVAAMPLIGGLSCGSLALLYPEITYQGFENVNALLQLTDRVDAAYGPAALLALVGVKMVATAVCRASGLVGGYYAPAIFVGAALGSAFQLVGQEVIDGGGLGVIWLFGEVQLGSPSGYALVGGAGMLAALCKVPLTGVLLLFELTRDYTIVLPTLVTVGIARWGSVLADRAIERTTR